MSKNVKKKTFALFAKNKNKFKNTKYNITQKEESGRKRKKSKSQK